MVQSLTTNNEEKTFFLKKMCLLSRLINEDIICNNLWLITWGHWTVHVVISQLILILQKIVHLHMSDMLQFPRTKLIRSVLIRLLIVRQIWGNMLSAKGNAICRCRHFRRTLTVCVNLSQAKDNFWARNQRWILSGGL